MLLVKYQYLTPAQELRKMSIEQLVTLQPALFAAIYYGRVSPVILSRIPLWLVTAPGKVDSVPTQGQTSLIVIIVPSKNRSVSSPCGWNSLPSKCLLPFVSVQIEPAFSRQDQLRVYQDIPPNTRPRRAHGCLYLLIADTFALHLRQTCNEKKTPAHFLFPKRFSECGSLTSLFFGQFCHELIDSTITIFHKVQLPDEMVKDIILYYGWLVIKICTLCLVWWGRFFQSASHRSFLSTKFWLYTKRQW